MSYSLPVTLLIALLTIGFLVTIHEAGHFFVARWFGIKVLRFSIGLGRPLWRWRDRHHTEYVLAMIPLGGYVRMLDSREKTLEASELSQAFDLKNIWIRIAVVLAGPMINLVFAVLAYSLVSMLGMIQLVPVTGIPPSESLASQAGIAAGMEIVQVDGMLTPSWQQVNLALARRLGNTGSVELTLHQLDLQQLQWQAEHQGEQVIAATPMPPRLGVTYQVSLPIQASLHQQRDLDLLGSFGLQPWRPKLPVVVGRVFADGPALMAGILSGDIITHVNQLPVSDYADFIALIEASPSQTVSLLIKRQGESMQLSVPLGVKILDNGTRVGILGISVASGNWPNSLLYQTRKGPVEALLAGAEKTVDMSALTLQFIGRMLLGHVSVNHLNGPISIAKMASQSAYSGWTVFISFLAYLSVSLGVLNLLPVPMLDGGHLLYYLIEMVSGRPVPERIQAMCLRIGLALLFMIMCIALLNDLLRL